jgi:multicomponent Na+:H+ antiporter subunit B
MKKTAFILVLCIGLLLSWAAKDFPAWGDPKSPASSSPVASHFIANTGVDTEVPNMVTAVLADYRGFDTMFETVVVFIAGLAVFSILRGGPKSRTRDREFVVDFEPDLIVTNTVRLIVPVIQIFALYVLAHGHVSPGGGFQGGVAMGASFILIPHRTLFYCSCSWNCNLCRHWSVIPISWGRIFGLRSFIQDLSS